MQGNDRSNKNIDKISNGVKKKITINRLENHFENRRNKPKSILLVDDELDLGYILQEFFQEAGHRFIFASSIKEGMEKIKKFKSLDLAIVDLKIGNDSGLTFIRKAKAVKDKVRFIMMSAFGDSGRKTEARRLGVSHFLDKPFKVDRLLDILNPESERVKHSRRENK